MEEGGWRGIRSDVITIRLGWSSMFLGCGKAHQALVFSQEDSDTRINFAHCQGYQHSAV